MDTRSLTSDADTAGEEHGSEEWRKELEIWDAFKEEHHETDAVASSLAKRRHDREIQQAVKIRRREEAEVDLMAHQDMRESFAEPELPPDPGPRSPSPPATYRLSGLPNRRRLPKRFRNDLPPIPVVASLSSTSDDANAEQVEPMDSQPPIPVVITTP
ncbi:hypothetical protein EV702DRAFT_1193589 [Suillus placidus]|uniref:Uncharacterized protein n=1 Tax=Suillus placidus TaxID=48579 RepID=A0A9P7A2Y6_9AGAM|nr:hypothetical protein EV702DRAFT_1193589 [Suillus placidus]